jgi:dihydroxyacetone kinase-like predicted kinase
MALETLSTADLVRVLRVYRGALALYRDALNRLNVYPVPDGDTGTNMGLTVDAVLAELPTGAGEDERVPARHLASGGEGATAVSSAGERPPEGAGDAGLDACDDAPRATGREKALTPAALAEAMSHGSLMGARGNSGVILSQVMRGLAGVIREAGDGPRPDDGASPDDDASPEHGALSDHGASPEHGVLPAGDGSVVASGRPVLGPVEVALALRRAADGAYEAVSNPVEGTMLTVARAAAEGAERSLASAGPAERTERSLASAGPAERTERSQASAGPAETARAAEQLPASTSAGVPASAPDRAAYTTDRANTTAVGGPCDSPKWAEGARLTLLAVLEAAREAAGEALERTTDQLPALSAAGVVDAGGAGLLLLYDSMLQVAAGREVPPPPAPKRTCLNGADGLERPDRLPLDPPPGKSQPEVAAAALAKVSDLRYEVMFLLEAPAEAMGAFREVWAGYGASIVIVGGDGLYNCHIHTDDIGGAIEAAIEIGRPRQIRVTDLAEQVEEEGWVREAEASGAGAEDEGPPPEHVTTSVVAVCAGEGVKRVFRSLGVRHFVAGGQSANPSVAEVAKAIAAASAEQVVVLPNNPNVVPAAQQAAANSAKSARVVPTGGITEGFAALLAYDPEADLDTNAECMAAAAARVLPGEVVRASRAAKTAAGAVREGDWLGLSRGELKVVVPADAGPAGAVIALLAVLVPSEGPRGTEAGYGANKGSEAETGSDAEAGHEAKEGYGANKGSEAETGSDAEAGYEAKEGYEMVTLIEGEGASPAATRRVVEWLAQERPWLTAEVHRGGQPLYPYVFGVE